MSIKVEIDLKKLKPFVEHFQISHLLLIVFALHMLQIGFPVDGKVFDEAHYTTASELTLKGIAANAEHPPLAKIFGAIGIAIFGSNWFGWRFPQVLFHLAAIYLLFLIAKRFMSERLALASAAFYSLDILTFIHGGTLLLDAPSLFFALLSLELYFRKEWLRCGVAFGLLLLCREMGVFYLLAVLIFHVVKNRAEVSIVGLKKGLAFLLIIGLVSLGGLWIYDATYKPPIGVMQNILIGQNVYMNGTTPVTTVFTTRTVTQPIDVIDNPVKHIEFILKYHVLGGGLQINETYKPWHLAWNWVLPVEPFYAPIYFSLVRSTTTSGETVTKPLIEYISIGTLPIWYAVWLVAPVSVLTIIKRKDKQGFSLFTMLLFWVNYVPWLVTSLTVHKIGFNYYFIYAVPALALAIPYAWMQLPISENMKKLLIGVHLAICVLFFLSYFPVKVFNF